MEFSTISMNNIDAILYEDLSINIVDDENKLNIVMNNSHDDKFILINDSIKNLMRMNNEYAEIFDDKKDASYLLLFLNKSIKNIGSILELINSKRHDYNSIIEKIAMGEDAIRHEYNRLLILSITNKKINLNNIYKYIDSNY